MNASPAGAGGKSAIRDFLHSRAPFDSLTTAELDALAGSTERQIHVAGSAVLEPGGTATENFFVVEQGCVRAVFGSASARTQSAFELGPGDGFPVGALMARDSDVHLRYLASEDTICLRAPATVFQRLLASNPAFHGFWAQRVAQLLNASLRHLQGAGAGPRGDGGALDAPLRLRLGRTPVTCGTDAPVRTALERMDQAGVGSVVVVNHDDHPLGIFTLRDVLPRVVLPGIALDTPIHRVMTADPVTLSPSDFGYEAALLMAAHGFRHICVVDEGRLVGVISERDLFALQRVGLVNLSQSLSQAPDVDTLARLAEDVRRLALQMMTEGAAADQLTGLITALNDRLTRRVIELCSAEHAGPVPAFTWLAFGSEGREEQTLYTDQDNGLLFGAATDEEAASARAALLPLATRINEALDRCGFPLCKGNVMASNPELCLSTTQWRGLFGRWIDQGTPEHLLGASIHFDFRSVHGDPRPVWELRQWLLENTARNPRFLRMMAGNALRNRPPIGFMGMLQVSGSRDPHPNTIDLKMQGLTPFVDGARILALLHGSTETNTRRRLLAVAESGALNRAEAETWAHALEIIQLVRLRHHRDLARAGQPFDNRVDPDALDELDRRMLKEAFRQARALQSHLQEAFAL